MQACNVIVRVQPQNVVAALPPNQQVGLHLGPDRCLIIEVGLPVVGTMGTLVNLNGVIIEFPDKNRPHLVLATATGATACRS